MDVVRLWLLLALIDGAFVFVSREDACNDYLSGDKIWRVEEEKYQRIDQVEVPGDMWLGGLSNWRSWSQ
jgi:hypothetical protein